jgi:hypothetical protein
MMKSLKKKCRLQDTGVLQSVKRVNNGRCYYGPLAVAFVAALPVSFCHGFACERGFGSGPEGNGMAWHGDPLSISMNSWISSNSKLDEFLNYCKCFIFCAR